MKANISGSTAEKESLKAGSASPEDGTKKEPEKDSKEEAKKAEDAKKSAENKMSLSLK